MPLLCRSLSWPLVSLALLACSASEEATPPPDAAGGAPSGGQAGQGGSPSGGQAGQAAGGAAGASGSGAGQAGEGGQGAAGKGGAGDGGAPSGGQGGTSSGGQAGAGKGGQGGGGSGGSGQSGAGQAGTGQGGKAGGAGAGGGATCGVCASYVAAGSKPVVGMLTQKELSGLAASRRHEGLYWTHNDSGAGPVFYGVQSDGKIVATLTVEGASATDWEDIAVGPCVVSDKTCVYIGDIGDNAQQRKEYSVYRVEEPDLPASGEATVKGARLRFTYPDGSHNAETLMVHPVTGQVYVVTKHATQDTLAFKLVDPSPAKVTEAKLVSKVKIPGGNKPSTGGDIHPCGEAFLLRFYQHIYQYKVADGQGFDSIFQTTASEVAMVQEGQGEAIAYRTDGLGYVTVSEGAPTLHAFECK